MESGDFVFLRDAWTNDGINHFQEHVGAYETVDQGGCDGADLDPQSGPIAEEQPVRASGVHCFGGEKSNAPVLPFVPLTHHTPPPLRFDGRCA